MDFFFPRRDTLYNDPWRIRERQNQQRQQQINEYDYPIFGNFYPQKERSYDCDCINCNMEHSLSEGRRHQEIPSKTKKELISERRPKKVVLENLPSPCTSSDETSESDEEETLLNSVQISGKAQEVTEEQNSKENLEDNTEDCNDDTSDDCNQEDSNERRREEISRKINLINNIKNDLEKIRLKIEELTGGTTKGKDYLYCEEMLTKYLLRLDEILADGEDTIRKARKQAVNEVNDAIQNLEGKLSDEQNTTFEMT